jgi:hypothetical protein
MTDKAYSVIADGVLKGPFRESCVARVLLKLELL